MRRDRFRAGLDKLAVPSIAAPTDTVPSAEITAAERPAAGTLAVALDLREGVNRLAEAREIALEQVHPNPHQPRQTFDEAALEELAASIREQGILQPLTVCPDDDGYRIVAGERRWRAAKLAGLTRVPALVRRLTEGEQRIVALMENLQREDLNDVDRARGLADLRAQLAGQLPDAASHTLDEEVGKRLGISGRSVRNFLSLLRLPEPVQASIAEGVLTEKHGRALRRLPDETAQQEAATVARRHALTGDETMALVGELRQRPKADLEEAARRAKAGELRQSGKASRAAQKAPKAEDHGIDAPDAHNAPSLPALERWSAEVLVALEQMEGEVAPSEADRAAELLEHLATRLLDRAKVFRARP